VSEVAREQGNVVLTADPFDDATAQLWLERCPFRLSQGPDQGEPARRARLWMPLRPHQRFATCGGSGFMSVRHGTSSW
jgi:hypothetical protein